MVALWGALGFYVVLIALLVWQERRKEKDVADRQAAGVQEFEKRTRSDEYARNLKQL